MMDNSKERKMAKRIVYVAAVGALATLGFLGGRRLARHDEWIPQNKNYNSVYYHYRDTNRVETYEDAGK